MQGAGAGGAGRAGGPTAKGRAWRNLLEVTAELIRRLDRELRARAGMDIQTYDVLLHLSEAPGGQRMTDLATVVVLSKSGLTALVDRLQGEGLIQRHPDPDDRRVTRVDVTAKGAARFREASRHHREVVHESFFSAVTVEEANAIAAVLTRVGAGLRADAPRQPA